jgi:5-methylcytosine-specific restriction endonuclease McrA
LDITTKLDPTKDSRCGIYAGYSAHRRRNEYACRSCKDARNERSKRSNRKSYYEKNKAVIAQQQKLYRLEHPELSRRSARKRRARLMKVVRVEYTDQQVLEKYGTNCHICSEPIDLTAPRSTSHYRWKRSLHIDHLIPISKGGEDTLENVRPAHGLCNLSKGNRI